MKTIKLDTSFIDDRCSFLGRQTNGTKGISFSICSEVKDGNAKTLTRFIGCREGVIGAFIRFLCRETDDSYVANEIVYNKDAKKSGRSKEYYSLYEHKDRPTGKTSIAALMNVHDAGDPRKYEDHMKNSIKRAIKILNHYERRNKWALSVAYRTNHNTGDSDDIYLFRSSKWWMTSTHTLSLYMLLIRLGLHSSFGNIRKSTPSSTMLSLLQKLEIGDKGYDDKEYPGMWNVLLDNRKKIYEGKTQKDNFTFSGRGTAKVDGIRHLCAGRSSYGEIDRRFQKLCRDLKK